MVEENFSNGTGACCTNPPNHTTACVMPLFSFSLLDTYLDVANCQNIAQTRQFIKLC